MPRTRSLAWAELKIGALAVLAIILATSFIFLVGNQGGFFWQLYTLHTRFDTVQGLKEGAVVRVAGVEVGTVRQVRFVGAQVEVVMRLSRDMQPRVTTDSFAEIGALSLLGEPVIDITPAATGQPLPDGGSIQSRTPPGQIREVAASASRTLDQINTVMEDIQAGKGTVGRLFTDEDLYREMHDFVSAAADVARQIEEGTGTAGRLVRDPALYQALQASVNSLQTMLTRINAGEGSLGRLMRDETFAKALTGATTSFETITARLNRGDGTAGRLLTETVLYDRLNTVTARLNELTERLNQGEGTAGQLLRDRQLYENMNRAALELRELVSDIRKDPRRYLNVRVSIF